MVPVLPAPWRGPLARSTETVTLRDYRLRHALHKADPDSQDAHRRHPWITIFDDHEVTNGYVLIDVTPQRVQADFYLTPEPTMAMPDPRVLATSVGARYAVSFATDATARMGRPATGRVGPVWTFPADQSTDFGGTPWSSSGIPRLTFIGGSPLPGPRRPVAIHGPNKSARFPILLAENLCGHGRAKRRVGPDIRSTL